MPTPNERKAIVFFSAVALLGGVVRVAGAVRDEPVAATAESRAALARQINAVDSARQRAAKKGRGANGRRAATGRKGAIDNLVDGPPVVATPDAPPAGSAWAAPTALQPEAQYLSPRAAATGGKRGGASLDRALMPAAPVDVDVATAVALEALPRVGPALARRIVESREAAGPFGSVAGLRRVRGVGPAVAAALAPYVTFSGRVRPNDASMGTADTVRSRRSRGRRSSS